MGDVTGPISSLPGHPHDLPDGATCHQHPDRPAVARIQGETDSFGCELIDMCEACSEEYRAYMKSDEFKDDRTGTCEWCKSHTEGLRHARDYDEGMSGRVYMVCAPCIKRRNDEAQAELDAMDDTDWDDFDDDEDQHHG